LDDVRADKCRVCDTPDALVSDFLIGKAHTPAPAPSLKCQDEFEAKSDAEKFAFWQETMGRCIRCYACRNACPMCVCRDHCI
ncbi:4Fe-4S ferredoxin, partial [Citrobacter sp. AAK_AS5]